MGLFSILDDLLSRGQEKQTGYTGLSIMEEVNKAAALKTSNDMPIEERLGHARKGAAMMAQGREHLKNNL